MRPAPNLGCPMPLCKSAIGQPRDAACIASAFLLLAIEGAVAAMLTPSPWFLLTLRILSLFLAIEKRKVVECYSLLFSCEREHHGDHWALPAVEQRPARP
jgi:hypothetical protein